MVSYMRFMNSYGGFTMNNNEILLLKLGEVVPRRSGEKIGGGET